MITLLVTLFIIKLYARTNILYQMFLAIKKFALVGTMEQGSGLLS